ncbi:hypothetical protein Goari_020919, partial [Gossypium aridum]|nr:hypothetical protein [Gossypium aridum]
MDVGYFGNWFTWERGNLPETNIQESLDRRVATEEWMFMFPEASIQHFVHSFFDHCPLLITTKREDNWLTDKKFKFKAWWRDGLLEYDKIKKKRKEFLTSRLSELIGAEKDDNNLTKIIDMKIQLNFEIEKDERYWEQRVRVNWLKLKDRNTSFFHSQTTQRQRKNFIRKIQYEDGRETNVIQEME